MIDKSKFRARMALAAFLVVFAVSAAGTASALRNAPAAPDTKKDGFMQVFLDDLFAADQDEKRRRAEQQANDTGITTEDEFNEQTKVFHEIPFNDTNLEFEIRLPRTWRQIDLGMDESSQATIQKLVGDIARFIGPIINNVRPKVTLQAIKMQFDVLPEYWLMNYVLQNGYTKQGDILVEDDKNAMVYYIHVEDDGLAYYTYMRLKIHGNLATLVRFTVPLQAKKKFAFVQKAVVDSFRFLADYDEEIEDIRSFSMMDSLKFEYPESWGLNNPDFKDPDKLSLELHNRDAANNLLGLIRLSAVRKDETNTLRGEINKLITMLRDYHKLEVHKLQWSQPASVYARFDFARMEAYTVLFKKDKRSSEQELWFVALGDKDWYIFMYMLTPKKDENLINWAQNTRTFDNMIDTLK